MRNHIFKALGIAIAATAVASSAQAQQRYHPRGNDDHRGTVAVRQANGDVVMVPRDRVPPGLAKKPLGMPPGQFKKHYTTLQGANSLSSVLRRNGFTVDRMSMSGNSRVVYYRGRDGVLHRAVVSPGSGQLGFSNVPTSLVDQVRALLDGR